MQAMALSRSWAVGSSAKFTHVASRALSHPRVVQRSASFSSVASSAAREHSLSCFRFERPLSWRARQATLRALGSTRAIHQSGTNLAVHVTFGPDFHANDVPGQMEVALSQLWEHVFELWNARKLSEALELCKARLADPFAHVPQPCEVTTSQLRVFGEFLLANILLDLHIRDDATQPDPTKNAEILRTLRSAKFGLTSHFPDELHMLVLTMQALVEVLERENLSNEAADEAKNVVKFAKARLELLRKDPETKVEDIRKAHNQVLWAHTRNFEYATASGLHITALAVATEGLDSIQEYMQHYSMDPEIGILYVSFLALQSIALADMAKNEASLLSTYEAVKKGKQVINLLREKYSDGITPEVTKAESIQALCSLMFARHMEICKVKEYQGLKTEAVCLEACETLRVETRLPKARSDGVPLDFVADAGPGYCMGLAQLSAALTDIGERITTLERAFEVALLSTPPGREMVQAFSKVPSSVAHEYYISALESQPHQYDEVEPFVIMLNKLTPLRIEEVRRRIQSEGTTQETDQARRLIVAELRNTLDLTSRMREMAKLGVEVRNAQLVSAEALINRGLYEDIDAPKTAAATWSGAVADLTELGLLAQNAEPDLVEQERLELLEKVEGYLSGRM